MLGNACIVTFYFIFLFQYRLGSKVGTFDNKELTSFATITFNYVLYDSH